MQNWTSGLHKPQSYSVSKLHSKSLSEYKRNLVPTFILDSKLNNKSIIGNTNPINIKHIQSSPYECGFEPPGCISHRVIQLICYKQVFIRLQKKSNTKLILYSKLNNKRRIGRPKTTWTVDVEKHLRTVVRTWWQNVEDIAQRHAVFREVKSRNCKDRRLANDEWSDYE